MFATCFSTAPTVSTRLCAIALFERVLSTRNDVGLLAEEYDPAAKRLLGNFPQAFSHVGVINTARNLTRAAGPAQMRGEQQRS
jgi:GH15 family glucan-1,4-alpha-glucosidase